MIKKSMKKNVSNYIAIGAFSVFSLLSSFEARAQNDASDVSKKESKKILTAKNFELIDYSLEDSTITISPVDNSIGFRDLTRALDNPKDQIPQIAERSVEHALGANFLDSSKIESRLIGIGSGKLVDPIYTGKVPSGYNQWKTEDGTAVSIIDPLSKRIFLWDNYEIKLPFKFIKVDTTSKNKTELEVFKAYIEDKIKSERDTLIVVDSTRTADSLKAVEEETRIQEKAYADYLIYAREKEVADSLAQLQADSTAKANEPIEALKYFEKEFDTLSSQYDFIKEIEKVYARISRDFGNRNTLKDDKVNEIKGEISDLEGKLTGIERLRRPSFERINSIVGNLKYLKNSNDTLVEREKNLGSIGGNIPDLSKYERISGLFDSIDVDTAVYPQIKFNVKEPVLDLKSEESEVTELNKGIQNLEYRRRKASRDDSTFWSDYTKQYYDMLSQTRDEKSKRLKVLEEYYYKGGLREGELNSDKKIIRNLIQTIDDIMQRKEVKIIDKKTKPKKVYQRTSAEEGFFVEPHMTTNFSEDNRYGTSIGYSFGDFLVSVGGNIGFKENNFKNTFLSQPNQYGLQYGNEIKTDESTNNGTAYVSIGVPLSQRIRLSVGPLADVKTSYTTENIQEQIYRNGRIISAQPGYQVKKNKTDVRYGVNLSLDLSLADKFGVVAGADFSKDARFKLGVRLGR